MKADDRCFPVSDGNAVYDPGLTVRDHIAIEAMKGMLCDFDHGHISKVAERAYKMADAMIEESEK